MADPLSAVVTALKKEHIVPDVLPASFSPSLLFSIVYPNGREVMLGNEFTIDEAEDEPAVSFAPMNMPVEQADSNGEEICYTLVMVDPDATHGQFRHWVVRTNSSPFHFSFPTGLLQITGLKSPADAATTIADSTALKSHPAITPYKAPTPRAGSGIHRYSELRSCRYMKCRRNTPAVFLLFQEPSTDFTIPENAAEYSNEADARRRWDVLKFAEKYRLKPVGANFLVVRGPPAQPEV